MSRSGITPKFRRPPQTKLTNRQEEVLQLVSEGLREKEIALELYMSLDTVKAHKKSILKILKANNSPQAVAIGLRRGFIK